MAPPSRRKFSKEKTLDDKDGRQVKENVGIENKTKNLQGYGLKNVHKNTRKKDSESADCGFSIWRIIQHLPDSKWALHQKC